MPPWSCVADRAILPQCQSFVRHQSPRSLTLAPSPLKGNWSLAVRPRHSWLVHGAVESPWHLA